MDRIANPHTRRSRIANAAEPQRGWTIRGRVDRIANPYTRHSRIANAAEPTEARVLEPLVRSNLQFDSSEYKNL